MKKAKVMLMAIAIFGVVGGALAFKAHKFNGTLKCGTTATSCPISTYTTTAFPNGTTMYCTLLTAPSTSCFLTRAQNFGEGILLREQGGLLAFRRR